jgi:hypothetical protein
MASAWNEVVLILSPIFISLNLGIIPLTHKYPAARLCQTGEDRLRTGVPTAGYVINEIDYFISSIFFKALYAPAVNLYVYTPLGKSVALKDTDRPDPVLTTNLKLVNFLIQTKLVTLSRKYCLWCRG